MEYTENLYRIVEGTKATENIKGHTPVFKQAIEAAKGYAISTGNLHSVFSYDQAQNIWWLEDAYCLPKLDDTSNV